MSTATAVETVFPGSLEDTQARIAGAYRAQFPTDPDSDSWSYVAATYPDEGYVIAVVNDRDGTRYFRHDFTQDGDTITFGPGTEMEIAVVPADVQESARVRTRSDVGESASLTEAAFDKDGRTLRLTVIRQGANTSKSRYYTESALRSGPAIFAGLKMYANHQTPAEEAQRPEGDLKDWVATLTEVAYDATGRALRGVAKIVDPGFLEKVTLLDEQGLLGSLGVSIRAVGAGEEDTIEGSRTFRVDEFIYGRSVDFVTEPGAGGRVESRESKSTPTTEDAMSAETIAAAERRAAEAEARAKEAEERAKAAEEKAAAAEEKASVAQTALDTLKAEEAKREAQEAIGKVIAEANLHESGQDYLRATLADETDVEKAREAVNRYAESVKAHVGTAGGRVTGMGESSPGTTPKVDLVEKMKRRGKSEEEARAWAEAVR